MNLKKIIFSKRFKKYLELLDGKRFNNFNKNIINKLQNGYCEDLCIYLKFNKIPIKIISVNNLHYIFKYKNRYYDSLTLSGVPYIKDIPFFKNKIIKASELELRYDITELPDYYFKRFKTLKGIKC